MADMNSFLQIFAVVSLVGVLVSFLIRVSIQALVLRYFTKKYDLSQNYGKAWLAILIPSLVVTIISIFLVFLEIPSFLLLVIWLFFFPILILSVKFIYKTETGISTVISLKFFLVILVLVVAIAGTQTILGTVPNPLKSDVPQSVCSADCEFAYRTDMGVAVDSLTITGYNIPSGKYQERENYIVAKETFSKSELDKMERGVRGKIIGKLDATGCNYMKYSRKETGGGNEVSCEGSSSNFFSNLQKILVG